MKFNCRSRRSVSALPFLLIPALLFASSISAQDVMDQVEHKYADSDGVSIHYAKMGSGPLMVFIHGFPDFWYSWRHQMAGLADQYTVAALDTRGYNLSDKPEGEANYDMTLLTADVAAVIRAEAPWSSVMTGEEASPGVLLPLIRK